MKAPAILLALILAFGSASAVQGQGQATPPPAADRARYGVYPIAYREIITRWLGERLVEPDSAKIEFGEPKPVEIKTKHGKAVGYGVDIRVNSRNKFGMYTGFQKWQIVLRNGEIIFTQRAK